MSGKTFDKLAPQVMRDFMAEFDLKDFQAAGILGNLGHESGLISGRQQGTSETAPPAPIMRKDGSQPKGGIDWPQWDGVRRKEFDKWVKKTKTDYPSYEASYGFMRHELRGPEKRAIPALKKTTSLETATKSFEKTYERAGVKAYDERVKWAKRALRLYNQAEDAVVA
jgi:hypothetical protein